MAVLRAVAVLEHDAAAGVKAGAGAAVRLDAGGLVLAGGRHVGHPGQGLGQRYRRGQGAPVVEATVTGRTLLPVAVGAAILVLAGVVGTLATRSWVD